MTFTELYQLAQLNKQELAILNNTLVEGDEEGESDESFAIKLGYTDAVDYYEAETRNQLENVLPEYKNLMESALNKIAEVSVIKGTKNVAKIALLTFWHNPSTGEQGYSWETPSEQTISTHNTREKALTNRPAGYKHLNDGWQEI